jgi:hypothetical protein
MRRRPFGTAIRLRRQGDLLDPAFVIVGDQGDLIRRAWRDVLCESRVVLAGKLEVAVIPTHGLDLPCQLGNGVGVLRWQRNAGSPRSRQHEQRDAREVLVKVLDGRAVNGKFWVFYGALSNVRYSVTSPIP